MAAELKALPVGADLHVAADLHAAADSHVAAVAANKQVCTNLKSMDSLVASIVVGARLTAGGNGAGTEVPDRATICSDGEATVAATPVTAVALALSSGEAQRGCKARSAKHTMMKTSGHKGNCRGTARSTT